MGNLLRTLLVIMLLALFAVFFSATGLIQLPISHIHLAIPTFLYAIFAQAFVMFYFIGTSKLADNIYNLIHNDAKRDQLFSEHPGPINNLDEYKKKCYQFVSQATLSKRKTIPWTMLILTLGTLAFLLGGAHDTGLVQKRLHVGPVYGFFVATLIGFFKQWSYLGKNHLLLRKLKALFEIPNNTM